jgi:hypothetical protein
MVGRPGDNRHGRQSDAVSLIPPQDITIPVSVAPDTITVGVAGDGVPVTVATSLREPDVVVHVPAGTVTGGPIGAAAGGAIPDNEVLVLGPIGGMSQALGIAKTSTGHRVHCHEIPGMQFEPGMGPFFSQVLPDGTVAMPQLQLAISQATNTGLSMSMGFWSQRESAFYTVKVPTTTGAFEVPVPGDTAGGADLSDCTVVTFSTVFGPETILFALSALPYRGWNITTYGEWPVLAAFKLDATTGRWAYYPTRSIWPATLRASDPLYGTQAWPTTLNTYGQTVTTTLLPAEVVTLPHSQHLAIAVYAPRSGRRVGAVAVIDADAKAQAGYYEFPDWTSPSGYLLKAFPRDINADPTSDVDDERILLNLDTFGQPNETWNTIIYATGGFWRISWNGNFTASLPLGAEADEVQAALEALPGIGAGQVSVRQYRAFLINTYTVYEIEMIGTLAHLNLSATPTALDASALVGNGGSVIHRWKTGSTALTDSAWFPLVELAYAASSGSLEPLTAPFIPLAGTDTPRPESVDASWVMAWYGQDGTAWGLATGHSDNPDNSTVFTFRGMHAWRKDPVTGERRYITDCPPTAGWETVVGSARAVPDVMTDGVHQSGGQFTLAVAEDQHSGGIVAATAGGRIKAALPTPGLVARSGNMLAGGTPTDWAATGGHTGAWDAVEGAFKFTSVGATNVEGGSPIGLAGLAVPQSMEGELVQLELEVRGATVGRLTFPVIRFYNQAGTEIGVLTGWGPAARITSTSYRTLVGSADIPVGTRFMAAGLSITGNANGEVHYVRAARLFVPGVTVVPDVDTGAYLLYTGTGHGSWLAKGFVDPKTRRLWLPYLQSMTAAQAKLSRFPAWLVGVDMARVFTDEVMEG